MLLRPPYLAIITVVDDEDKQNDMMSFHIGLESSLTISLESVDILHYAVEVTQRKFALVAAAQANEIRDSRFAH